MVFHNFRAITQDPRNILDILIVAFVVYEVIALVRKTRAAQVAKGAVVVLVGYAFAYALELRTVTYLMNAVLQIGFLALIVLFQPELRRALEQVGCYMFQDENGQDLPLPAEFSGTLACAVAGGAVHATTAHKTFRFLKPTAQGGVQLPPELFSGKAR